MRSRFPLLLVSALLFACERSGDGNTGPTGSGGRAALSPMASGQTGSPNDSTGVSGTPAPCAEGECRTHTLALAELFFQPRANAVTFTDTRCSSRSRPDGVTGAACDCTADAPSGYHIWWVGPVGWGCYAQSRTAVCLWGDDEPFAGCDADDPDSCDATCAELQRRLNAEWERVLSYEVRHTECIDDRCRAVLQAEDRCFAELPWELPISAVPTVYECNLSDDEILEADRKAHEPPEIPFCDELPPGGNVCERRPCESSADCKRATACIDLFPDLMGYRLCDGCSADSDCLEGEGCGNGYCLLVENLGCRSNEECPSGSPCLVESPSDDGRGNEGVRSYCDVDAGSP